MRWLIAFLGMAALLSCGKDHQVESLPFGEVPRSFPEMNVPPENTHSAERWALGKALFFDTRLSAGNDISCATCHKTELFFADNTSTTAGTGGALGLRNVPSLANVGYLPYLVREGSVPTLEMQVLVPIQEHNEFNTNIITVAELLSEDEEMVNMSMAAYGEEPSAYTITRALAVFERSIVSSYTRFDYFQEGHPEALSVEEKKGMDLFFSDQANCASCHGGFLLSNHEILNNGLYSVYQDSGLYRLSLIEGDIGKFKVPSLRNVAETGPYMHDGSLHTLEGVLAHYTQGGQTHYNQDLRVQPLDLNESEQKAIIAFLNTLTDESFVDRYAE